MLVNSVFFNKRVHPSKFFRDLTLLLVGDALAKRHGIHVDTTSAVILRNKKVVGELGVHRIRKRPRQAVESGKVCDKLNGADKPSSPTDAESEAMEVVSDENQLGLPGFSSSSARPQAVLCLV